MSRAWHDRRWRRFLVEYVGNLDVVGSEPPSVPSERRTNHHGRALLDWFKKELAIRRLPPEKTTDLLNGAREAVRTGESFRAESVVAEQVDRE